MSIETEWWEKFFSGLWLDVQRQIRTEEQTRIEADFAHRHRQASTPRRSTDGNLHGYTI